MGVLYTQWEAILGSYIILVVLYTTYTTSHPAVITSEVDTTGALHTTTSTVNTAVCCNPQHADVVAMLPSLYKKFLSTTLMCMHRYNRVNFTPTRVPVGAAYSN